MINRDLIEKLELNEAQRQLLDHVDDITVKEQVEVSNMDELRDLLIYLEEKIEEYPELNKLQLGMVENKVEAALAGGTLEAQSEGTAPKKKSDSEVPDAVSKTAKQVAKTTAGTVGRQVGKELGEKLGGAFGKTLGGNVGAELARSIVSNFGK